MHKATSLLKPLALAASAVLAGHLLHRLSRNGLPGLLRPASARHGKGRAAAGNGSASGLAGPKGKTGTGRDSPGASDAIISIDASQRIVLANRAAAALFGSTVKAMEGAPLNRFIPSEQRSPRQPEVSPPAAAGLRLDLRGRRSADHALTGRRANGELFPLEGTMSRPEDALDQFRTLFLRDITERSQVQQKLQQTYTELRELSAALQTIREEERTHIARELHDDLGQLLATLRVNLALLQQDPPPLREQASALLQSTDKLLMQAITSLRRIASNLRPRALDEGGLYFALETLRQEFVQHHGIACELHTSEEELTLDDRYSTTIFRIVQEALTNIARHARAMRVLLHLHRLDSSLLITIEDDGRGIRPADMDKTHSYGLVGMRERVYAIHGDIAIGPGSDGGTRIHIRLPITPRIAAGE
ncbi:PAS domain-containing sensor histidine kinase [Oxalobacteraceae bacterium]|nr:PAS domain-containing sensor histidine kinase [Oxalobacteraceae bacterium]